jgi:hypothetical protein
MSNDLVPSVSVENMVSQRAAVFERMQKAFELIQEAASIAACAHLGMPRITLTTEHGRGRFRDLDIAAYRLRSSSSNGSTFNGDGRCDAELHKALRLGVDASAWQYLMHESGMRTFMDAEARRKWDDAIAEGDIPELNDANVRSTFTMLQDSRGELFERGVIAVFKSLSWSHKTNLPQKFGKRIVLRCLRSSVAAGGYGSKSGDGLGGPNYTTTAQLDDLTRVFSVLDGKPEPDHRNGWCGRLSWADKVSDGPAEDEFLSVRSFRNGNGHVVFKRTELVDSLNAILAKHYEGALPAPKN